MRSHTSKRSLGLRALLLAGVFFAGCSGTGSGPSEKQVRDDWERYVRYAESLGGCPDVKLTDAKVVGTSVEGRSAEVILRISGEWISKRDPGYMGGACWKFSRSRGATQMVERHLTYKKFDTGWRLDHTDDPMLKNFR
jgi:hypothetical protein